MWSRFNLSMLRFIRSSRETEDDEGDEDEEKDDSEVRVEDIFIDLVRGRQIGERGVGSGSSQLETLLIGFEKGLRVLEHLLREPRVISAGVPFPGNKILKFPVLDLVSLDRLNFVFFFLINDIRRRFREVRTVYLCFLIG